MRGGLDVVDVVDVEGGPVVVEVEDVGPVEGVEDGLVVPVVPLGPVGPWGPWGPDGPGIGGKVKDGAVPPVASMSPWSFRTSSERVWFAVAAPSRATLVRVSSLPESRRARFASLESR